MQCLYCGSNLGLLSRGEFCSKKHQELWRAQQAELSIQRLKEAFSVQKPAEKPIVAKSRPTSVSVLDSLPKEIQPPPEFFAYDDPPARKVIEPPPPPPAPAAEEKPGVFYCGPAAERAVPSDVPPDAGFVSISDLNKDFRLPVFIRRPTVQTDSGALDFSSEFIQQSFARQILEQRLRFAPAFSISSVEGCETRLFGHSIPKPCVNLLSVEGLQVQLRSPETPSRPVFTTEIQACAPQPEKLRAEEGEVSPAVHELGPMVLFQGEAEPADWLLSCGLQGLPGIESAAVQQPSAAPTTQEAPRACYGVGPMALLQRDPEPADRLASSSFQPISSGHVAPVPYSNAPTLTRAVDWQNPSGAKQAPLRKLVFPRFNAPVSALQPCKHSAKQRPAQRCVILRPLLQVGAMPVLHRGIEGRAIPAQYPKNLGSLPRAAASQPAASIPTPRVSALTTPRAHTAPAECSFQALATTQLVQAQARFIGVRCAEAPRPLLALKAQPRPSVLPGSRVLLCPVEAFGPQFEQPKTPIQYAPKRVFDLGPAALLRRQNRERTSYFVPYTEAHPAALLHSPATHPQLAARVLAPRKPTIPIGRTATTLPDCTFQILGILEKTSAETRRAALPTAALLSPALQSIDSPRQKFMGKFVQLAWRRLDLQSGEFSALEVAAIGPEKPLSKVCRPAEPVHQLRPLALVPRNVERPPVAAGRQHGIILASTPYRVWLRPEVASRGKALSVALGRLTPPLTNSSFQALSGATNPRPHSEHSDLATRLSTSLAKSLADTVHPDRRQLEFEGPQLFSAAGAVEVVTARPETPGVKPDGSSAQAFELRLIALEQRPEEHKPKFVQYPDIIQVSPRRTAAPSAAAPMQSPHALGHELRLIALERRLEHNAKLVEYPEIIPVSPRQTAAPPAADPIKATRAPGITNLRPAILLPNCSFDALASAPGASPAHWRTAAAQIASNSTVTVHIAGRGLDLTGPGSVFENIDSCLGTKRRSSPPEFATKSVSAKFDSPSSRLLCWDSDTLPFLQLDNWPNRSDANLLALSSTATSTVTWANPEAPLDMPLHPREVAAAARAAAGSTKPPAPRRDLRWVAQKVPFAPRP